MSQKPKTVRFLFVCLGNICRSPLAESVFRHLVAELGIEDRFEIDSAGTSGYHNGAAPDPRSVATAKARGVAIAGRSRQLTPADIERFDYVIAMDGENFSFVQRLNARSKRAARVHLLREWDPEAPGEDVPDPYYGGVRGFEDVHDIVERSCRALLEDVLARSDVD